MHKDKKQRMLIVDDKQINRSILRKIFEGQYEIKEAEDGQQAIDILKEDGDEFTIVLLDLIMPKVDGFGVLKYMKDNSYMGRVPVVLITADEELSHDKISYDLGVADIVRKPFDRGIILRRVKNIVELYNSKRELESKLKEQELKLLEKSREIHENNEFLVDALSSVVEFRSLESGTHIKRIKYYTKILLANLMRLFPECGITQKDIDRIVMASALHDIGKVGISDDILLKPSRLTKEEFEIMKTHSEIGGEIIKKFTRNKESKFYQDCYDICMYHHERDDGKGYPKGLVGDEIPLSAQVVSVADVFDALVSERVYKEAYTPQDALDMIFNGECGKFSDLVLKCLDESRDEYIIMAENLE